MSVTIAILLGLAMGALFGIASGFTFLGGAGGAAIALLASALIR